MLKFSKKMNLKIVFVAFFLLIINYFGYSFSERAFNKKINEIIEVKSNEYDFTELKSKVAEHVNNFIENSSDHIYFNQKINLSEFYKEYGFFSISKINHMYVNSIAEKFGPFLITHNGVDKFIFFKGYYDENSNFTVMKSNLNKELFLIDLTNLIKLHDESVSFSFNLEQNYNSNKRTIKVLEINDVSKNKYHSFSISDNMNINIMPAFNKEVVKSDNINVLYMYYIILLVVNLLIIASAYLLSFINLNKISEKIHFDDNKVIVPLHLFNNGAFREVENLQISPFELSQIGYSFGIKNSEHYIHIGHDGSNGSIEKFESIIHGLKQTKTTLINYGKTFKFILNRAVTSNKDDYAIYVSTINNHSTIYILSSTGLLKIEDLEKIAIHDKMKLQDVEKDMQFKDDNLQNYFDEISKEFNIYLNVNILICHSDKILLDNIKSLFNGTHSYISILHNNESLNFDSIHNNIDIIKKTIVDKNCDLGIYINKSTSELTIFDNKGNEIKNRYLMALSSDILSAISNQRNMSVDMNCYEWIIKRIWSNYCEPVIYNDKSDWLNDNNCNLYIDNNGFIFDKKNNRINDPIYYILKICEYISLFNFNVNEKIDLYKDIETDFLRINMTIKVSDKEKLIELAKEFGNYYYLKDKNIKIIKDSYVVFLEDNIGNYMHLSVISNNKSNLNKGLNLFNSKFKEVLIN